MVCQGPNLQTFVSKNMRKIPNIVIKIYKGLEKFLKRFKKKRKPG
jgi:hypothetical protein